MSKPVLLTIYIASLLALIGCGSLRVKVSSASPAEATKQAQTLTPPVNDDGMLSYENEMYGFTFEYPATWTLQESANAVTLHKENVVLNISVKRDSEDVEIRGSGMPAGEMVKGESARVLGIDIPKTLVVLDGATQSILYGEFRENANVTFVVRADAEGPGGISETLHAELDAIVGTLDLTWAALPLPEAEMADWPTYTNEDYGFMLRYPETWMLEAFEADQYSSSYIVLNRNGYTLFISFKANDEEQQLGPTGVSAGEFQKGEPLLVLASNQTINRVHLVYEDRIKAIFYGENVGQPVEFGELQFAISLNGYAGTDYEELDLPQEVRDEADAIIATLTFTAAPRG